MKRLRKHSSSLRSEKAINRHFYSLLHLTHEENLRPRTHDAIKLAPRKKGYNMPDGQSSLICFSRRNLLKYKKWQLSCGKLDLL
ncbi:hypothetical protein ACH3XW_6110 [Acanthocheilonema viteae]